MTTLLSRFLRESESKIIQVGAKSAPMYALQVKQMLAIFNLQIVSNDAIIEMI